MTTPMRCACGHIGNDHDPSGTCLWETCGCVGSTVLPSGRAPRPPKSPETIARMKATIAARQAAGLPFGRPRERAWVTTVCKVCEVTFGHWRDATRTRLVCSRRCSRASAVYSRRKLPDDAVVAWLYAGEYSLWQIARKFHVEHSCVRNALIRVGAPRRRVGPRRRSVCREEGCTQPIYRIVHKRFGPYGTRCQAHWRLHRLALAQAAWNRTLAARGQVRVKTPRTEAFRLGTCQRGRVYANMASSQEA